MLRNSICLPIFFEPAANDMPLNRQIMIDRRLVLVIPKQDVCGPGRNKQIQQYNNPIAMTSPALKEAVLTWPRTEEIGFRKLDRAFTLNGQDGRIRRCHCLSEGSAVTMHEGSHERQGMALGLAGSWLQ
jgi:hypothetical protein